MSTKVRETRPRRGVSVAFFSIGSFAIAGMTGLAVDGSGMYLTRLHCQAAADAGALAAAHYVCAGGSVAIERGKRLAARNGIPIASVEMEHPYRNNQDWVGCKVSTEYTFKFLAALGFDRVTIGARAVAEASNHVTDQFHGDLAILGKKGVDLAGRSLVDAWDSRNGTYASQATQVDPHTGMTYALAGGTIHSDCAASMRGKNYVSGSVRAASEGGDCGELATHLTNRGTGRTTVGGALESESGAAVNLYDPSQGWRDNTEDTGDSGQGKNKGGGNDLPMQEQGDGDILLQGRHTKKDAALDAAFAARLSARCSKPYGQEYTADADDGALLRSLAADLEKEGQEYLYRAPHITSSFESQTNGQRLKDDAASLSAIAGDIDRETFQVLTTPPVALKDNTKRTATDSSAVHRPGLRDPVVPHCGLIEIRGSSSKVERDAVSDGPIVLRGQPRVGKILPYNDVAPLYAGLEKADWSSIATLHNNDNLRAFGTAWNESTRRLKVNGNADVTIPAGRYYLKELVITGHSIVRISGNVTLYVEGGVRIEGHARVNPDLDPRRLVVYLKCPSGSCAPAQQEFVVRGHSTVAALVLNESGDIDIAGHTDFYGSLVSASLIQVRGASSVHVDRAAAAATNRCSRSARLIY